MRVQYYFLLTPQFLSGRSLFFFVPSTSKNLEAQGPSYTECPLPPNFWRLRVPVEVEGPVLLLLSPPVFKREEGGPSTSFGKSWRQRDRGLRGYCILSATREEPHPPGPSTSVFWREEGSAPPPIQRRHRVPLILSALCLQNFGGGGA